jgi:hypothetical protein
MRGATPAVANALIEWDAGERRLEQSGPVRDARLRVVAAVDDELRRRVGSTYSLGDLLRAYDGSSSWFLELAERVAPGTPAAWDPSATLDAAFARWARNASDSVAR